MAGVRERERETDRQREAILQVIVNACRNIRLADLDDPCPHLQGTANAEATATVQKSSSARGKASNQKKSRAAKIRNISKGGSGGRGNYKCKKCGKPKRGHVCKFDFWDRPVVHTRTIACQTELDSEMTVRKYKVQCAAYAREELRKQKEAVAAKAAAVKAAAVKAEAVKAAAEARARAVKASAANARSMLASSSTGLGPAPATTVLTTPPFPVQRGSGVTFLGVGVAGNAAVGGVGTSTGSGHGNMDLIAEGPEVEL